MADEKNTGLNTEIFHVHTYRCRHAENVKDEAYVQKAISLGADSITFTDHAPFPDNPFGNRMNIDELDEYVDTLSCLRKQYQDVIRVNIGLEIEYLPLYEDYYFQLKELGKFDVLMLGQHFYDYGSGQYSFSLKQDERKIKEAQGICRAMIQGMKTGCFHVVAHPDRMFRYCNSWTNEMKNLSCGFIQAAKENKMVIEKNISSMDKENMYWEEFWSMVPDSLKTVVGIDAHAVADLDRIIELKESGWNGIC